jgi:hypothetical protein
LVEPQVPLPTLAESGLDEVVQILTTFGEEVEMHLAQMGLLREKVLARLEGCLKGAR